MAFDSETFANLSSPPQATLIVKQGAQIGIQFPVTAEVTIIGREETCDIVIQDAEASRRHTQLSWEGNAFVVRDMGSTNGTFVNGTQITTTRTLTSGDTIGLGQTSLVLEIQQSDSFEPVEYGPAAQEYHGPEATTGLKQLVARPNQKWWMGGCGCLVLLCGCLVIGPIVLQSMGIINLAELNQLLGF